MTQKVAYLWGPLSSFFGPLAAWLVTKGWHVHIATKPSLNLFSLSPLDLKSTALDLIEQAMGGHDRFRPFQDRFKWIESTDAIKGTKYDALIFCGLPPNFDEARVPRAPWAAADLPVIAKALKGVPTFVVSSLWGGVQADSVVPEEFEFERRKPMSHWESVCQHYENKLLSCLSAVESPWYMVRIPMIAGSSATGESLNFSGPSSLLREVHQAAAHMRSSANGTAKHLDLSYNPDSTFWFLPIDMVVSMFWRFLEDENRPRICNLVSTQVTLNREWMHHLAEAVGLEEITPSSSDHLNLPGVLRRLLTDDMQVRTRNLFEVIGRYQLPPVRLDRDYFEKLLAVGKQKHWGRPRLKENKLTPFAFSEKMARFYFEEYIPAKFDMQLAKEATAGGAKIGFFLKDADELGWVLSTAQGYVHVTRFDPHDSRPEISLHFTGETMMKLVQGKLPLHRALLLRDVEMQGPLLQSWKVSNIIERFFKDCPLEGGTIQDFEPTAQNEREAEEYISHQGHPNTEEPTIKVDQKPAVKQGRKKRHK